MEKCPYCDEELQTGDPICLNCGGHADYFLGDKSEGVTPVEDQKIGASVVLEGRIGMTLEHGLRRTTVVLMDVCKPSAAGRGLAFGGAGTHWEMPEGYASDWVHLEFRGRRRVPPVGAKVKVSGILQPLREGTQMLRFGRRRIVRPRVEYSPLKWPVSPHGWSVRLRTYYCDFCANPHANPTRDSIMGYRGDGYVSMAKDPRDLVRTCPECGGKGYLAFYDPDRGMRRRGR